MEDGRMDDEQVEELRRWAKGLAEDPRPELRAAARAIHLLADDVVASRSQLYEERLIREALESRDSDEERADPDPLPDVLRARLRGLLRGRRSE
jgi:hypothetical protein